MWNKGHYGNTDQTMNSYRNAHQSESVSTHFSKKNNYDVIWPELTRTCRKWGGWGVSLEVRNEVGAKFRVLYLEQLKKQSVKSSAVLSYSNMWQRGLSHKKLSVCRLFYA